MLQFDGSEAADLSHRYLWGPNVDQLMADEAVTSLESEGDVLWPLGDHLNSIRDLATHDSGTHATTIANHRNYDSYGNLVSETEEAVDEIFGFTGRQFDDATGLQYNLNRWYDAGTGRWMSEDPSGFKGNDSDLSRYVANNPLSLIDPTGLAWWNPMDWWRRLTVGSSGRSTIDCCIFAEKFHKYEKECEEETADANGILRGERQVSRSDFRNRKYWFAPTRTTVLHTSQSEG